MLLYLSLAIFQYISWIGIQQIYGVPLNQTELIQNDDDDSLAEEYANLKHILIYNYGYSKEFTDLVETNLKRAVREEKERQRREGSNGNQPANPNQQRQEGNPGGAASEEDYDDESTTPAGPTTPGASPGDVVRGVAGILTSLGTFNVNNFWNSFVNFFPPTQREGAQALVDASLGRRPSRWPTIPTTTTKLTTTTKDEDEIDYEETTKVSATSAPGAAGATTLSPGVTPVPGLPGQAPV